MKYLPYALIFSIFIFSCKSKCTLGCKCRPTLRTTGYSNNELKEVLIRTYVPDGTFSTLLKSYVLNPTKEGWWLGVNSDTASRVFTFNNLPSP